MTPLEIVAYAAAGLFATLIIALIVMIIAAVVLQIRKEFSKVEHKHGKD